MQTVLDIIRHYSGAGKEDKDMTHECSGSQRNDVYIDSHGGEWTIEVTGYPEGMSDTVRSFIPIDYCPFCGVKLDEA